MSDSICFAGKPVVAPANSGQRLRTLREALGYTMRDVERASLQIAQRLGNDEYAIQPSRLSDMETKGIVPSIFRVYSMAAIYHRNYRELLSWYGVDLNQIQVDTQGAQPPKSHLDTASHNLSQLTIPVSFDPGFHPEMTTHLSRMIEKWGGVPISYLASLNADKRYSYGYIGSEDFTMYPILLPGSFVQLDETKTRVTEGTWRTEFERPIYFVETRDGFVCCWCHVQWETIVLQPHPLSPVQVRMLQYPRDAEIIGQVVGAAMRLGDWHLLGSPARPTRFASLS